ncbi:DUF3006 family protein [Psychrobacillus sp.]|uniref:DUF3006 family protein n=1 Tax=Psychrobacillus sp. TaxID=1871623 RepID=UPI0028BF5340|nr:DUF3006 family protein [Psychrobacillus sp.]
MRKMTKVKYTLDKIEGGQYVFLERENEEKQLLIPSTEINVEIVEGSIVLISQVDLVYEIEVLIEETDEMKEKVSSLLEKLKNKKL